MTVETINKALDELYQDKLNKNTIRSKFNEDELLVLSAPFLIKVPNAYTKSKKRVLYIGKETNIWWGKLKYYIEIEDSINILKKRYAVEFEGGKVPSSKDVSVNKSYEAKTWKNNAFFSKFTFLENEIDDSTILWTNLLKVDSGEQGYSKNSINDERVRNLSKEILIKEIEILKPDAIIFVTATSTNLAKYDTAIKDTFNNSFTHSKVIKSKEFWIFEYNGIKCYRTLHPLSYRYKNKATKYDYYKDIAEDINNGFQLFTNRNNEF